MTEDSACPPSPPSEEVQRMEQLPNNPVEENVVPPSPPSSESGLGSTLPEENDSDGDGTEIRKRMYDTDNEDSYLPARKLRSVNSTKKARYEEEPDFDSLVQSVHKTRKAKSKQDSRKFSTAEKGLEKCPLCRQVLVSTQLTCFNGAPEGAVSEKEALQNPDLKILGKGEAPLNRVVLFSVYDENWHLCPLDGGAVERGVKLHISGYIKPIFDEDRTSAHGGTPAKDIGPITQWWIGGYEEHEPYIGLSTDRGEYILGAPSPYYISYLEPIFEKVFLSKLVIQFLQKQEGATYQDLLTHVELQERPPGIPVVTEDSLVRHAQFICDQVVSYDEAGFSDAESDDDDDDWRKLIQEPCMSSLMDFAGARPERKRAATKDSLFRMRKRRRMNKPECELETWTKATTTPLVRLSFGSLFWDQIDNEAKVPQELDETINLGCEDDAFPTAHKRIGLINSKKVSAKRIDWLGTAVHISKKETYYSSALVGEVEVNLGDFVSYSGVESALFIGKVQFMWEDSRGEKCAHLIWFTYGKETLLGKNADPHEIFMTDRCEAVMLNRVRSKVDAHKKIFSDNWHNEGGLEPSQNDPSTYYYSKMYDENRCRFEDISEKSSPSDSEDFRYCPNCEAACRDFEFETPSTCEPLPKVTDDGKIEYGSVTWRGETYTRGQSVYLDSNTFDFDPVNVSWLDVKYDPDPVDFKNEELYPERYRKKIDTGRGSNDQTPDPFCIGLISRISANRKGLCAASEISLKVYKYYRPENTKGVLSKGDIAQIDYTMLFASEEEVEIDFSRVRGKCYVVHQKNLGDVDAGRWSLEGGPDRFYFQQSYDPFEEQLKEPLEVFTVLGKFGNETPACDPQENLEVPEYPPISRKLRCLDLFAGCGGLSDGLRQSGVAEAKWAIEKVSVAAKAYQLNNPQAEVFTMDVNDLLKDVMQGETRNDKGQIYPQKGDVDMIVGGPPCQGFSGLNRFTKNDYSQFKNSLIVSMISYCDYYRPKYFVVENVRNLVAFGGGTVLTAILKALLNMGYQASVGVLQAGHYGVPQTRKRTFIFAAAPGEVLPQYPEARHVFNQYQSYLAIFLGDSRFDAGLEYTDSAPYRTITVYDAMSDLPDIKSGFSKEEIEYSKDPETHFQRQVRDGNTTLRDHICKDQGPIVQTRIDFIPKIRNADWRDLPNFEAVCANGVKCSLLLYTHHDPKVGRSKKGALRGVCSCAMERPCEPTDHQVRTLIPWSLPHTAKRNGNWVGIYGRIQWDEYFITTVTNPEPMGKQGRVLHPVQNRVVSVRECARSQGFDDSFLFYGNILEKHKQVGNAVPPPMVKAIGLEFRKSVAQKEQRYVPPFAKITRDLVAEQDVETTKQLLEEDPSSSESEVDDNYLLRNVNTPMEHEDPQDDLEDTPVSRRSLGRKCKLEPKVEQPPVPDAIERAFNITEVPNLEAPNMPELKCEMADDVLDLTLDVSDLSLDVPNIEMPQLSPQIDAPDPLSNEVPNMPEMSSTSPPDPLSNEVPNVPEMSSPTSPPDPLSNEVPNVPDISSATSPTDPLSNEVPNVPEMSSTSPPDPLSNEVPNVPEMSSSTSPPDPLSNEVPNVPDISSATSPTDPLSNEVPNVPEMSSPTSPPDPLSNEVPNVPEISSSTANPVLQVDSDSDNDVVVEVVD